jgi:hypothetical protein
VNDSQILDRICDRYMEEAGEDMRYALRLLAFDFHRLGGMVSSGYARVAPVSVARPLPKARVEALDIPAANTPQAASPNS